MQGYSAAALKKQRDRRLARRLIVLIAIAAAISIWSSRDYTRPLIVERIGDKIDRQARKLAGPDAVDCGRAQEGAKASQISNCAEEAHAAQRPFRVRFDAGWKSFVLVGTPDGRVIELNWDSAGNPNAIVGGTAVLVSTCSPPALIHRNSRDVVTCLTDPGSGFLPVPVVR